MCNLHIIQIKISNVSFLYFSFDLYINATRHFLLYKNKNKRARNAYFQTLLVLIEQGMRESNFDTLQHHPPKFALK